MSARLALIMGLALLALEPHGGVLAQTSVPSHQPVAHHCNKIQEPRSDKFYESNPTYTDPADDAATWKISTTRTAQKALKVNGDLLQRAADELAAIRGPRVWSFLVVRNDHLVLETYYDHHTRDDSGRRRSNTVRSSNNIHSASKSIWGAAVGIAISKGILPASLDTKIWTLLPTDYQKIFDTTKRNITVEHLLTMSSGLEWTEDKTDDQIPSKARSSTDFPNDWVAAILALPMASKPGSEFKYSTGNTHLISAILERALRSNTKVPENSACQFIHAHLLGRMGVFAEHWGRDPQGNWSGGYNVYLTARELAKFGMLYLNGGAWHDEQVIPSDWVKRSLAPQKEKKHIADDSSVPHGYGYLFWLGHLGGHEVKIAWGHGGQMIYIIEDLKLVVVITTDTRDPEWYRKLARWLFRSELNENELMEKFESVMEEFVIPAVE